MNQISLQFGEFVHGFIVEGYEGTPEALISIDGSHYRAKMTLERVETPSELVSCSCMFQVVDRSYAGGMGLHELPQFLEKNNISLMDLLFKDGGDPSRSFDYFTTWLGINLEKQRERNAYRQERVEALKYLATSIQAPPADSRLFSMWQMVRMSLACQFREFAATLQPSAS